MNSWGMIMIPAQVCENITATLAFDCMYAHNASLIIHLYYYHWFNTVYYLPWDSWDIKQMITLGCERDQFMRFFQLMEAAEQTIQNKSAELGQCVPGFVLLIDLNGFSLTSILSKAGELSLTFVLIQCGKMWKFYSTPVQISFAVIELIIEMAKIADNYNVTSKVWALFNGKLNQ